MIQWHEGKTTTDHDRINPSDDVDRSRIFLMGYPEGLKGALKAMDQVDRKSKHSDQVNDDEPKILKGDIDTAINVLDGFVMTGVGDHGKLVSKAHFDPEVTHVDAEEGENEDTQDGHVFGGPGGAGDFAFGIFGAFGTAVHEPEGDSLNRMYDNEGIQADGDKLDEGVMRHESRVDIEGAAPVIGKELEVAGHVNDEKEDQEEAGETHDDFLAQARSK